MMKRLTFIFLFLKGLCCAAINIANDSLKSFLYVNELYSTWQTDRAFCYSNAEIPNEYLINLKNGTLPTTHKIVTSKYGYRPKFGRFHKGVDVKLYIGDTVVSAFDGVVRVVKYDPKGYGNYIVVRHPNGLETIYGHLSKHLVHVNDVVKSGEAIGLGGNTGRSTGSHLHFETRIVGVAINPELMFDFPNQKIIGESFIFKKNCVEKDS